MTERIVMKAGVTYSITQHPKTVEIPIELWNAVVDDLDALAAQAIDLRIKLVNAGDGNERE